MATYEDLDQLYLEDGNCAICNKPTVRAGMERVDLARDDKEPFICADCLVDLHKASHTKLTVLQRIGLLEAKAERIESKVDTRAMILNLAFTIALAGLAFLAGFLIS